MNELLRYDFLDALPQRLFDAVVNHPHGRLKPRSQSMVELRAALLSGRVPERLAWPEGQLGTLLLDGLRGSNIASMCDADAALTDDVLLAVLDASSEAQRKLDALILELGEAARAQQRRVLNLRPSEGEGESLISEPSGARRGAASSPWREACLIDELTWQKIRVDAERLAAETLAESLSQRVSQKWGPALEDWSQVRAVLSELSETLGCSPSGLLKLIDWRRSAELRRFLAGLPVVRSLIRSLGRQSASDDGPEVLVERQGPVPRTVQKIERVRELGPVEIRGVERSDEVARMLPSEAMLRRHPILKWLWHARRAERALLTYHAESVYTRRIQTEEGFAEGMQELGRRSERGPVIVILDTSGSMIGSAETLAKAVVLQILCTAQLEKRPCYVYSFSGNGQLAERELSLGDDGLADALAFLSVSFHGGTQLEAALRRAVERLAKKKWAFSDIVIVSDGLWTAPDGWYDPALVHDIERARERHGVRVHAALTQPLLPAGVHELVDAVTRGRDHYQDPHGMVRALCDPIHELSAWLKATN